jgi:hypothetical protein
MGVMAGEGPPSPTQEAIGSSEEAAPSAEAGPDLPRSAGPDLPTSPDAVPAGGAEEEENKAGTEVPCVALAEPLLAESLVDPRPPALRKEGSGSMAAAPEQGCNAATGQLLALLAVESAEGNRQLAAEAQSAEDKPQDQQPGDAAATYRQPGTAGEREEGAAVSSAMEAAAGEGDGEGRCEGEGKDPPEAGPNEELGQQRQQQAAAAEQLAALQERRQRFLNENQALQRWARQHIDSGSKASKQSMEAASCMAGAEQRYLLGLQQLQKLLAQRSAVEARVRRMLAPEKVGRVGNSGRPGGCLLLPGRVCCLGAECGCRGILWR